MPARDVPVLVVEDDDDTREVLRLLLEDEGYRVLEARDGAEGLGALRASREPLVVIVDWWMPLMDGLQMLGAAARLAYGRHHRYVLLSATYDPRELRRRGLPALLDVTVMRKPFHVEELLAEVAYQAERVVRWAAPDAADAADEHLTPHRQQSAS
ncbi:MAG TPA: response regulator [Ktedonobacterales bacterium]